MAIAHYIKEIGRGARGAKALERAQAADLMGQLLDGQLNDLEIGAFCVAMRIKGETVEEMCGFLDAVQARSQLLPATTHPGHRAAQLQRCPQVCQCSRRCWPCCWHVRVLRCCCTECAPRRSGCWPARCSSG